MSRKCAITGKGVMSGNNVSHANNKSRRRFLPNLQPVSFWSDSLKRKVSMRVTVSAVRTIEHKGGLDNFLMGTSVSKLDPSLRQLRKAVEKAKTSA